MWHERNDRSWSPSPDDRWLFHTGRFHPPLLYSTFFSGVSNHLKTRAEGKTLILGLTSLQKMIKDVHLLFPLMMWLMGVFLLLATTVVNTLVWKPELAVSVRDKHYVCCVVWLFQVSTVQTLVIRSLMMIHLVSKFRVWRHRAALWTPPAGVQKAISVTLIRWASRCFIGKQSNCFLRLMLNGGNWCAALKR